MNYKSKTLKITSRALIFLMILSLSQAISANQFTANTNYTVCFTPGDNCTNKITQAINNAQQTILMQAYTITSYPIENALIRAKNRGVTIKIIMDKNQYSQIPAPILYLTQKKIPIWFDSTINGLAHNKVIIIDNHTVITGSFNFTKAAQKDNAENVLIIEDTNLADQYTKNWLRRFQYSCLFNIGCNSGNSMSDSNYCNLDLYKK